MRSADLTVVLALAVALLGGGVSPCRATQNQEAPAGAPDSDGDGIPDAQDPHPLIADFKLLTWYVSKIEVGWHVKTEGTVTETESLTWERNKSEVEVKGNRQQILGEAGASLGMKAQTELNANPLREFGLLDSKAKAEFQAKAGLSYSGQCNWSRTSRSESRQAYEYAQKLVSQTRLHEPYIEVWIEFCNHSKEDLTLTPELLTIFVGGKPMVEAEHAKSGALTIPAERSDGIPERFKATLDTTGTLGLLDGLRNGAPSVALERSRMVVRDPSGRDAISAAKRIDGSTAEVRVSAGELSYAWRVACTDQSRGQATTLRQAMEAISARLGTGLDLGQLFMFKGDSLLKIAGADVGSDKGQWFVSFGGGADQIIDAAALSRKLCIGDDVHFGFKGREQLIAEDLDLASALLTNSSAADDSRAIEMIRKYADQGNPRAQYWLGNCYSAGEGVPKDREEAARWYRKAADQGLVAAQRGLCFLSNLPEDSTNILKESWVDWVQCMRKVADQGDPEAQYYLGCYYDGMLPSNMEDHVQAINWYRKAADQGHSLSQYSLGKKYLRGMGVRKDEAAAVTWFQRAAAQGHEGAEVELRKLGGE